MSFSSMRVLCCKSFARFFLFFIIIIFNSIINVFAQSTNDLKTIINELVSGNSVYNKITAYIYDNTASQIIIESQAYEYHDDPRVRRLVYKNICKAVKKETGIKTRQKGVFILVDKGLFDSDAGNIYRVINYLDELPEAYFDGKTKNRLATLILKHPPHFSKLIRLIGKVNVVQLLAYLEVNLQNDKELTASEIWNVNLVLARWGDEVKAEYCVESVKRLGLSDEIVFRLVPDLIYTQQRVVFNYLFDVILKDELNCSSTDPDNEIEINCAYRLLEYISPHISDFPLRLTPSGELDVEDYEEALFKVRAWIESNRHTYQMILN